MVPAGVENFLSQTGRATRGLAIALCDRLEASGLPFAMTCQARLTLTRGDSAPGPITSVQQEVLNRRCLPRY